MATVTRHTWLVDAFTVTHTLLKPVRAFRGDRTGNGIQNMHEAGAYG